MTLHFVSKALPEPHTCGGLLCAECARHGLTAVHFSPAGLCAWGHQLEAAPDPLAAKLAAWLDEQGIRAVDSTEALAGRLLGAINPEYIAGWLHSGNTSFLRTRAEAYAHPRELTDAEHAAEMFWHGHDPH